MALVGDVIQFIVSGTFLGQEIVNVFFYGLDAGAPHAIDLGLVGNDWMADFESRVLGDLSDEVSYTQLVMNNLTDGLEFAVWAETITGGQDVVPLPSFCALGVTLLRSNRITRNGGKRFPGLGEAQVDENAINPATINFTDIENFCGQPLVYADYNGDGDTVILRPIIVGRSLNIEGKYELDLNKINPIDGAQVRPNVSTQNTRKV